MSSSISVKIKLQVIDDKVMVPGHEPLSEQTTNSLSVALQGADTFLSVDEVLKLIPNARLIVTRSTVTAGNHGHDFLLELPVGPPDFECPQKTTRDVYKILQDAARFGSVREQAPDSLRDCSAFSADDCELRDFSSALDPAKRS